MGKIIAIFVVLVALCGGAAAGYVLRPAPPEREDEEHAEEVAPVPTAAITRFREGFVVPVLRDGTVWSHVVLNLGIETDFTAEADIFLREPVLRDGLTEALFLHANFGGFDGDFTDAQNMNRLRVRLNEVVQQRLGDDTARILIVSMARQAS
ncbi:hypothetical protein [Jannaschia pohangensis]|uniref:Flagellar protein FliL n=1 Tax=Jannaschia pohangensis TaxID=390807 RepID=A0A1I3R775_9RHOB|nr:hypothetical protein [Jannaschia pohangensis]SFJ42463.1 hypothetical protein SAMN04488095_2825 [Jannaschia pohangensis]